MGSVLKYGCGGALMLVAIGIGLVVVVVGFASRPESNTARAIATVQAGPAGYARPEPTLAAFEGVTESQVRAELEKGNQGGSITDPVPVGKSYGFLVDHQVYLVSATEAQDVSDLAKDDPLQKPPIGYSAVAVGVTVSYFTGPEGRPLRLSDRDFQIVANNRLWEDPPLGKALMTPFGSIALLPGGKHDGLLPTKFVSQGLVDETLLKHRDVYFSLKDTHS